MQRAASIALFWLLGCNAVAGLDGLTFGTGGGGNGGAGATGGDPATGGAGQGGALSGGGGQASDGCLEGGYLARRSLQVDNAQGSLISADVPIAATLSVDELMGFVDPRELQLAIGEPPTRVPRWVDLHGTTVVRLWFQLPGGLEPDSTAALYLYRCPLDSPEAMSDDPEGFFELYEPFDTFDDEIWLRQSGDEEVVDGELRMELLTASSAVRTVMGFSSGMAVDILVRITASANDYWGGFQGGDFDDTSPYFLWAQDDGSPSPAPLANHDLMTRTWGNSHPVDPEPHWWQVDRYLDRVDYRYDALDPQTIEWTGSYTEPIPVRIDADVGAGLRVDIVRVRRTPDPWPAVTLGAVERGG